MTGTVTTPRMTVEEIRLVRAVVKWRRGMGISFYFPTAHWYEPVARGNGVTYDGDGELGISREGGPYRWIPVGSVTEAVDILVAKGFLPARFSSAYWDGWNDAIGSTLR